MKKKFFVLLLAMMFSISTLTACESEAVGAVDAVSIRRGGSEVAEALTVNIADKYVIFGADVKKEGAVSGTVTFTSSSPEVATITSSGVATLVGEGETTITAVSVADNSKSDSITLKVTNVTAGDANVPSGTVESIQITLPASEYMQDEYLSRTLETGTINFIGEIKTTGNISTEYTFTSSNPEVATVTKDGKATLLSSGHTTITITSDADVSKTHSITLNVKPNPKDTTNYTIKINGGYAEHNSQRVTSAREKDFVYLYPEVPEGQELKGWICTSGNAKIEDGLWGKLTMPAADVEFTAVFGPIEDGIKLSLEGITSQAPFTVTPVEGSDYTALNIKYESANAYDGLYGYYTPPYNSAAIGGMGNDPVVDTTCSITVENKGSEELTIGIDLRRDDTFITDSRATVHITIPAGETVTEYVDCSGKLTIFQLYLVTGGSGEFTISDVTFRQK